MPSKATSTRSSPVQLGREEPHNFETLDEFLCAEYAPESGRTILLGCGRGHSAVYLARKGYRVLGIDADRDLLAAARERAILGGVEMDLMAGDPVALPPMPEEAFALAVDLYTACDLGDGAEREEYLRQIHRMIMRNGVLLASAPAPKRRAKDRRSTFAFAGPFVSDFTRAGFEVLFEGIRTSTNGEARLVVHGRKPL